MYRLHQHRRRREKVGTQKRQLDRPAAVPCRPYLYRPNTGDISGPFPVIGDVAAVGPLIESGDDALAQNVIAFCVLAGYQNVTDLGGGKAWDTKKLKEGFSTHKFFYDKNHSLR